MKCPKCGSRLHVVRTYSKGGTVTVRYRKCKRCGAREVTTEIIRRRGDGGNKQERNQGEK